MLPLSSDKLPKIFALPVQDTEESNFAVRDIKGANILVDPNGEIKLVDFGLAKHVNIFCIFRCSIFYIYIFRRI